MVEILLALVKAPLAEPYTGPAILSGRASAVFFHEIFGHRIEGQRQKNEDEAQTFKKRVNQAVLPEFLNVYSDPSLKTHARTELVGYYPYDDEGVKARRVTVVDKGILKNFLMSRAPIEGFAHSNGHGRRQQGYKVVARQSNLVVESSKQVSRAELKKLLIEQIKAANKPYGLFFDDIEGGFTFTQRFIPNAFNVRPTVVYRIYPDGKEELVRGVDLIGTPLIAFSKISAADDQIAVFNGVCGAESGMGSGVRILSRLAGFTNRSSAQGEVAGACSDSAPSSGDWIEMIRQGSSREAEKKESRQGAQELSGHRFPTNMRKSRRPSKSLAFSLFVLLGVLARAQDDIPMRAMKDELSRSITELQLQKMEKPYFLAYRMDETHQNAVWAMLGSITQEQPSHTRMIGVEVRVGDYALDNSNYVSLTGLRAGGAGILNAVSQAPIDNDYRQIRRDLWLATDRQYKKALEDLSAKRAALQMRKRTDDIPDFSRESSFVGTEPPEKSQLSLDEQKALARDISAVFLNTPEIQSSSVELQSRNNYTRYVNSEGSAFTRSQSVFKLQINIQTYAADGLPISDSLQFFGSVMSDLPAKEVLIARTRALAERILKNRSAASLESYNGPVLFEGDAAGEVFSQQFASGLLAVRTPVSDDPRFEMFFNQMMTQLGGGSSFADKVGGRVLPEFLSVSDNPLPSNYKGARLLGTSTIDDDAVQTRETKLIQHGVLKTLLATRVPVHAVPHSTGSRRGWGPAPSNLFLTSDKSMGSGRAAQRTHSSCQRSRP